MLTSSLLSDGGSSSFFSWPSYPLVFHRYSAVLLFGTPPPPPPCSPVPALRVTRCSSAPENHDFTFRTFLLLSFLHCLFCLLGRRPSLFRSSVTSSFLSPPCKRGIELVPLAFLRLLPLSKLLSTFLCQPPLQPRSVEYARLFSEIDLACSASSF